MTRKQAEAAGERLLKRMKGKAWKLRIWENLGWQYEVVNGPVRVYSCSHPGKEIYHCLIGRRGGGEGGWTTGYYSSDPNKVVKVEAESAREELSELITVVEHAEAIAPRKVPRSRKKRK